MTHVPRRIDILAFENVQLLDVTGPLQVFASANKLVNRASGPGVGDQPYTVRAVAARPQVTTSAGLTLLTHPLSSPDDIADTLIVAGGQGIEAACEDAALLRWIRAQGTRSRRIASVCSGAFLLAAAGLLDEVRVVTHWGRCDELARRFPKVTVDPDPIFIREGRIWTSAGVTAGIDLALAMVEEDLGREIALDVARDLVVFLKRPGGQAQFSAALSLQTKDDRFAALHGWIVDHLDADLSVPALAARAGMSERSFVRHYRTSAGMTPARAIERLRVEAARRMLDDSAMPVKRVAARCGFGTEETMRRSFLRTVAVTPQAYRERFAPSDEGEGVSAG